MSQPARTRETDQCLQSKDPRHVPETGVLSWGKSMKGLSHGGSREEGTDAGLKSWYFHSSTPPGVQALADMEGSSVWKCLSSNAIGRGSDFSSGLNSNCKRQSSVFHLFAISVWAISACQEEAAGHSAAHCCGIFTISAAFLSLTVTVLPALPHCTPSSL